jgi:hypothetical protein
MKNEGIIILTHQKCPKPFLMLLIATLNFVPKTDFALQENKRLFSVNWEGQLGVKFCQFF